MRPARPVVQSGAFVETSSGSRLRIVSEPRDGPVVGTIVFVHAFAEEMNKSRRMVARMSRLLAADGWRVVQRDLRGCGDSAGEFADATWDDWLRDVDQELSRCDGEHAAWLWCHRAGALLAPEALRHHRGVDLLLWQPVLSGAQHLSQFLRLHAGARIVGSAAHEAGPTPMQRLRAGETVEIGGYSINPALALGMERARFELPPDVVARVLWFDVVTDLSAEMPSQAAQALQRLRDRSHSVDMERLAGPPFWQTQEIEDFEPLLERTRERMERFTSASGRHNAVPATHDVSP